MGVFVVILAGRVIGERGVRVWGMKLVGFPVSHNLIRRYIYYVLSIVVANWRDDLHNIVAFIIADKQSDTSHVSIYLHHCTSIYQIYHQQ